MYQYANKWSSIKTERIMELYDGIKINKFNFQKISSLTTIIY